MKTKIWLWTIMALFLTIIQTSAQSSKKSGKILVAYFSHSGNTRNMANQIKEVTGGDIFEIQPLEAYPSDYKTLLDQAKTETKAFYKPALKAMPKNIDSYNIIIIGSPNWWSTIAPPVASFLSKVDLKGKIIVPFMTHGGGRMGHSMEYINKLCPDSKITEGLPIRGNEVTDADTKQEIVKWLKKIEVIK
ncbi:MAG: NAD(P)H-dependent oxidoreductase [Bacteroides sp.]|jgi:flavodoxin|nr:NAD(P)H-dependent oxidoreductase [Bacteroides sp.]